MRWHRVCLLGDRALEQHDPNGRPIEVWGGAECTINRVGDQYFDQFARSGHSERQEDLDLFAALGIRALRYPVLWERTAPDGSERADWTWSDERLGRLRALGVRPIVGLVHHGSGPRDTNLLDPAFPERLAEFAAAVAQRYPWVEEWTPVNEPLTTARFAALYGHWYPHARDDLAFARALLTQCRAVVLAMRAIRAASPVARLVQTDDLGKSYSTPALAYQAEFENERRWVTFDLLAGRLTPDRPMWRWLRKVGLAEADLAWFLDNPCPPDIVGVNTYLSSERFLDERLDRYPTETPGTNGRHSYVDVLAARVLPGGAAGPEALLREAWERYRLPVAVTEAHNGSTREEQLRWLDEVWRAAEGARAVGADVRAVTVWSLLGAYDWHTLVTRDEGVYEPGVFDLRAPTPRPTAVARMTRDLATTGRHAHPVLATPGWWRRPDRFIYGHVAVGDRLEPAATGGDSERLPGAPILIIGVGGPLGGALARECRSRGLPTLLLDDRQVDLADPGALDGLLRASKPWAVIDAGDGVRPDAVEPGAVHPDSRTAGPSVALAAACAAHGLPLLAFSSDLVFAGVGNEPYTESNLVGPTDDAGRSLATAEVGVLAAHPTALLVRTGPLFGWRQGSDVVATALEALAAGLPFVAPRDETVSPTHVDDLVSAALDLLVDGERGTWHLVNPGAASWDDFLREAAVLAGLDPSGLVRPASPSGEADRPRHAVLGSERGWPLPPLTDALARYVRWIRSDAVPLAAPPWEVDRLVAETTIVGEDGLRRPDAVATERGLTEPPTGAATDVVISVGSAPDGTSADGQPAGHQPPRRPDGAIASWRPNDAQLVADP